MSSGFFKRIVPLAIGVAGIATGVGALAAPAATGAAAGGAAAGGAVAAGSTSIWSTLGSVAKVASGAASVVGAFSTPDLPSAPTILQPSTSTAPTAQQKADADAAAEEVKAKEEAAATEAQRTELLRVSKKKGRQSTILAVTEENKTGNLLGG